MICFFDLVFIHIDLHVRHSIYLADIWSIDFHESQNLHLHGTLKIGMLQFKCYVDGGNGDTKNTDDR